MRSYPLADPQSSLEPCPPLAETPGYRIVRGNPVASLRLDIGARGSRIRSGIWACTEGAFECVEKGDELQTVTRGRLRIVEADGTSHEYGPGDSFVTRKGEQVVWDIIEDTQKVFFTYDEDGDAAP